MRIRTGLAVLVTAVTIAACDDVPLLPQWSADFYLPVASENLQGLVPGVPVPASASVPVNTPVRQVPMDGTAGDLLEEVFDEATQDIRIEVRVTKPASLPFSLADTLYMAGDSAGLATTAVREGFAVPAGVGFSVDTVQLGASSVALIQALVASGGTLHIQARGRVSNGPALYTTQASDSIHVKLGLLVAVPVAGGN